MVDSGAPDGVSSCCSTCRVTLCNMCIMIKFNNEIIILTTHVHLFIDMDFIKLEDINWCINGRFSSCFCCCICSQKISVCILSLLITRVGIYV